MKLLMLFLVLLPCLISAQPTAEDYEIYSKYLNRVKTDLKGKANFVVCESVDNGKKYGTDLTNVIADLRNFAKDDYTSLFDYHCDSIVLILRKDTTWIGLVSLLNQKMKSQYILKNQFSPALNLSVMSDREHAHYFNNNKHLLRNWKRFHKKYPIPAYLISLSEIVKDSDHAVFYYSRTWDAIGNGWLVLFDRKEGKWKFLQALHIWDA